MQFFHVGNKIEDCKLGLFEGVSFAVTCETSNQRQEVHHAYSDHIRVFRFHGCVTGNPQSLTAVPSLKKSLDACLRKDGLPALQFGLSFINANELFFSIHILILVFLNQVTMFQPTFPTVLIQLNSFFSKTTRQWLKWSTQRTNPKFEARHATAQSWFTATVSIKWSPQLFSQPLLLHRFHCASDDGSIDDKSRMYW